MTTSRAPIAHYDATKAERLQSEQADRLSRGYSFWRDNDPIAIAIRHIFLSIGSAFSVILAQLAPHPVLILFFVLLWLMGAAIAFTKYPQKWNRTAITACIVVGAIAGIYR